MMRTGPASVSTLLLIFSQIRSERERAGSSAQLFPAPSSTEGVPPSR